MHYLKAAVPYMLLYVMDYFALDLRMRGYVLLCGLLLFTQVSSYFSGLKRGITIGCIAGEIALRKTLADIKQTLGE